MSKISETIERALTDVVRPRLAMHAGGIDFISFNEADGNLTLKFTGMCKGCPMSEMTMKMGVEGVLMEAVPEVKKITVAA
jgi:Fe-S cluster biogenesis protein NfuA